MLVTCRSAWQFPIVLCLYDSFLTAVDLAQNALLADLSDSGAAAAPARAFTRAETERAEMSIVNSVFAVLGAATVFSSSLFWDTAGPHPPPIPPSPAQIWRRSASTAL